jgi:hypothetical protein
MTDSSTHCYKSAWPSSIARLVMALLLLAGGWVQAQVSTDISQLRIDRSEDEWQVSAQVQFEMPPVVEDALMKGIPMVFVISADVLKERWYWYWSDKRITSAERHMRLAYQPLTRRWRLNVGATAANTGGVGLTLSQSFDSLSQALSAIKRISNWRFADAAALDASAKYKLDFRFRLDLGQLPRPFQIGAIGQTEWDIAANAIVPFVPESIK